MLRILRVKETLLRTGDTRSPHYAKAATGLFTRPIKIGGARSAGWPEFEVDAIVAARIAGTDDRGIRALVIRLHEQRKSLAVKLPVAG